MQFFGRVVASDFGGRPTLWEAKAAPLLDILETHLMLDAIEAQHELMRRDAQGGA
jgi:hypothetical protein